MVDPPVFIETFFGFGAKVPLRRLAPLGRPETQFSASRFGGLCHRKSDGNPCVETGKSYFIIPWLHEKNGYHVVETLH